MSKDTIYRQSVIDAVIEWYGCEPSDIDDLKKIVDKLPSADRPQGEWIPCTKEGLPLTELGRREGQKWYGYKCSKCNFVYKGNALTESPFCQNCGIGMKGADDE